MLARDASSEIVRCLEAETGKELWQDKYDMAPASGPAAGYSGPRSSPSVSNGKVVTYGLRGTLTCYDASTGKLVWRKDSTPDAWPSFFTSASPLVVEDVCIAQLGGPKDGSIAAFDLNSGEQKWKWAGDGSQYGSPVAAEIAGTKVVLAQTDRRMIAVSYADGKLLWEMPFQGKGMGGMNTATPIVDGQTVIYSGSGRGVSAAKFEKQGDALMSSPLWTNQDNSIQYNSPILNNGLVYGYSARDVLFCIDAKDGKTLWTSPVPGKRGFGAIVDAGSAIFLLNPIGTLFAFEPNNGSYKQLASYKVADGDTTASPVISGKDLFIKDKDSLTRWSLP